MLCTTVYYCVLFYDPVSMLCAVVLLLCDVTAVGLYNDALKLSFVCKITKVSHAVKCCKGGGTHAARGTLCPHNRSFLPYH
jgi:hypothetical protein